MKYNSKDIEEIIYSYFPEITGYEERILKAMEYSYKAGGKRLRPMMMKLCYDMYQGDSDSTLVGPFMAAIEMIHTYSLIHDDLPALDNDDLRRGKPTCHVMFGEDMAILAGDGLLNYAFETASKAFFVKPGSTSVERAFAILAKKPGVYGMIGGQTIDVAMSGSRLSEEDINYIYENKTSALIECAMMIGATLGGAKQEDIDKLELAARAVGMAFQVQDDILDIVGDENVIGKPVASDEKNDKYTYATIHGLDKAREYVKSMSNKATELIASLNVSDESSRKELMELINSLIDRDR